MALTLRAKLQTLLERGNTAAHSSSPEGALSLKDTLARLLDDFEATQARLLLHVCLFRMIIGIS